MTAKSIEKDMQKQLFKALEKIDRLEKKLNTAYDVIDDLKKDFAKKEKKYKQEISNLKIENNELKNIIKNQAIEINDLKGEIKRLRAINNKDSSNSSKPSSTNNFKKVITNRREKSSNKSGKPKGSRSTNLSKEKIKQLLDSKDVEIIRIDINKNNKNKNMKEKIVRVIDIKIIKRIIEYHYYPNNDGTYDIPKYHNRPIQYGENLKTICLDLLNEVYNSTDGVTNFINSITNGGITLSKSTLIRWNSELSKKFQSEINFIEKSLLESYYLNHDESSIKINGLPFNELCACNEKHTRLWISKNKKKETLKEIGFLEKYKGIIVKDGTELYNGFGIILTQCISHILRYLKGIYDFVEHKGARKMAEFLQRCIHIRKEKISKKIEKFTNLELEELYKEYDEILREWKKEWMKSDKQTNPVYEDERRLLTRMEEEEKDKNEILYFLKDFKVPSTNNQAETDQRNIKIKQKIGKFRSVEGASDYAINRSCINTYKKNNINVFKAIKEALIERTILI